MGDGRAENGFRTGREQSVGGAASSVMYTGKLPAMPAPADSKPAMKKMVNAFSDYARTPMMNPESLVFGEVPVKNIHF